MSVHRDCGEEIKWARREDDETRWNPPLEYAGNFYIIDESGAAIQVTGYKIHYCDPDRMEAWQERCRRIAEMQGGDMSKVETQVVAADMRREEQWEVALKVECETCEAKVNEKCHSMARTHRKNDEIVPVLNPHPRRLERAYKEV